MAIKKMMIGIVFIGLLVVVALLVYVGQWHKGRSSLYYSGTFEATSAHLAFQTAGKIIRVYVDEGQRAEKDQLLAELDRNELQARYDQAAAKLAQARLVLEQRKMLLDLYRRTLPSEVERVKAAAKATAFQLAELRAGTRAQDIERAQQTMLAARAVKEDTQKNRDKYDSLFQKGIISEKEWDDVNLKYETALRDYERSREAYNLAKEGVRKETIQAAQARLAEAEAAVTQSRSNLKRIDVAEKDVNVAQSQVELAEAARTQAQIALGYSQLRAPFAGIITCRSIEPGECVTAGEEVLTLSDLSTMDLKIFVDETRIGTVRPGQKTEVRVDSFPGRTFEGIVTYISPEAEFTPKIIQTQKERVKLVYLVKVSLPNSDLSLKPGIPADAWLK